MGFGTPSSTSGGVTPFQRGAQKRALGFIGGKRGRIAPFDPYGGNLTAPMSGAESDIISNFVGSDMDLMRNALSDIAEQDAISRAQLLLEPSLQRSINLGLNDVRQRYSNAGLFNGSNMALAEGDVVGRATGDTGAALANLIPGLTQLKLNAATALPGATAAGLGIASIPRLLEQQNLDRLFQEFMRTNPSGGPLQALLGLAGGPPGAGTPAYGQSAFAQILPLLMMAGGAAAAPYTGGMSLALAGMGAAGASR